MLYTNHDIESIYQTNLEQAIHSLQDIPIARGRKPSFQGLNGWVYEQTIRSCLEDELQARDIHLPMSDQVKLSGRAKVDLFVGKNIAVEIKAGGIFKDDAQKYARYCKIAKEAKLTYLYITKQETYRPYRDATIAVFGNEHAYFLDDPEAWGKFVIAIVHASGSDVLER